MAVKVLEAWLRENRARIASLGFAVTTSPNGNSSDGRGWCDLEGPRAWGRVTYWAGGHGDMEVLDRATGETTASWPNVPLVAPLLTNWLAALENANRR